MARAFSQADRPLLYLTCVTVLNGENICFCNKHPFDTKTAGIVIDLECFIQALLVDWAGTVIQINRKIIQIQ